jgi:hypothetical protein
MIYIAFSFYVTEDILLYHSNHKFVLLRNLMVLYSEIIRNPYVGLIRRGKNSDNLMLNHLVTYYASSQCHSRD